MEHGHKQAQANVTFAKVLNQGWISLQCLHLRGWILVPLCRKYRITGSPMCLCPPKQVQPVPSRDVCNMAQSGCQMEFLVETQAQAGPSECGPLNKNTRVYNHQQQSLHYSRPRHSSHVPLCTSVHQCFWLCHLDLYCFCYLT